jgi:SAM-dependent methyltransferase
MSDLEVAAAKAYEALFVPALFGEWASKIVDAAGLSAGQRVLDVACGTGVLAREAIRRTGGHVAGLDPGAGMLAVARELAPEVDWRQGRAEALPFADQSFDVVVSQFGLMFMDRDRAIREMLRVLRPGGRLVVAVWDSLENIPAYAAETALLERLVGTRAADALRAPFVLGDSQQLVALFEAAGAKSFEVVTQEGCARFPSIRAMVEADLRGWLPVMGVNLDEAEISRVLEAAQHELANYSTPDGHVTFATSAHVLSARR